jgi:hypothetical protein
MSVARDDGDGGADRADRLGDRVAMRAGHDHPVVPAAEFADRAGDERRATRVEVVNEELHVEIAVGAVGGGEGVLDLGVERILGRLDEHGDAQRARDAVAQRPIELEFARPLDDALFLVRIDAAAAVQHSVDGGSRYAGGKRNVLGRRLSRHRAASRLPI